MNLQVNLFDFHLHFDFKSNCLDYLIILYFSVNYTLEYLFEIIFHYFIHQFLFANHCFEIILISNLFYFINFHWYWSSLCKHLINIHFRSPGYLYFFLEKYHLLNLNNYSIALSWSFYIVHCQFSPTIIHFLPLV